MHYEPSVPLQTTSIDASAQSSLPDKNRVVFIGKNPLFLELLKSASQQSGTILAGVLWDTSSDPDVGKWLDENRIPSASLETLRSTTGAASLLHTWRPDFLVNYNTTFILRTEVLAVPARGALNLHPGLLPEYAGLHTHQWAIRNGEQTFGATLHWMDAVIDAGDIVFQQTFDLTDRDTGLTAYLKCLRACQQLISRALDILSAGQELPRVPQDLSRRKLYKDIDARDGRIDWRLPAHKLVRFFRASNYGVLKSPTYEPTTHFGKHTIILSGAQIGEPTEAAPGMVVSANADQIRVACGSGESLCCKVVRSDGPMPTVGDRFGARSRARMPRRRMIRPTRTDSKRENS